MSHYSCIARYARFELCLSNRVSRAYNGPSQAAITVHRVQSMQVLKNSKTRATYQEAAQAGAIVSTLRKQPAASKSRSAQHVDGVVSDVQGKQQHYDKAMLEARKASDLVTSLEDEIRCALSASLEGRPTSAGMVRLRASWLQASSKGTEPAGAECRLPALHAAGRATHAYAACMRGVP